MLKQCWLHIFWKNIGPTFFNIFENIDNKILEKDEVALIETNNVNEILE